MSRAYRVRVSESVTRVIHIEDGIQAPLELLPILAPDRMADLLAAELEALGFVREGGRMIRDGGEGGTVVEVDLAAATITVRRGGDAELTEEDVRARASTADVDAAAARLRAELREDLEERIAERAEKLRRQVTAQLEAELAELRAELDGAVGRATIKALTERAGQLGDIESIATDEAGNVTIKVKV